MSNVALITGATGAIGQAISIAFARAGFDLALHYRANQKKAEALKKECLKKTANVEIFQANLADSKDASQLIKDVSASLGAVHALVNNAGITHDQLLMRMSDDDFWQVIQTNLGSVFQLSKAVIRPMMKAGIGHIINITSVVATLGTPGQANYVSSKAAIEGFTRSLSKEIAKKGVSVNAVAPGFIDTAMTSTLPEALKQSYLEQIPMHRFGTPDDVAEAVLFLATKARYMTGQTIHVNGGMIG